MKEKTKTNSESNSNLLKEWFSSARKNHLEKIQEMESKVDLDIDIEERQGWNALRVAAYNSSLDVTNYLLKKGSSCTLLDIKGNTILHDIGMVGTALPLVLPFCKNADLVNFYGTTPIMIASSIDAINAFLKRGADINRRNQMGGGWLCWNMRDTHLDLLEFGTTLPLTWDDCCSIRLENLKEELQGKIKYPEREERVRKTIFYAEQIHANALRRELNKTVPVSNHSKNTPKL